MGSHDLRAAPDGEPGGDRLVDLATAVGGAAEYAVLDPAGRVVQATPSFEVLTGAPVAELAGQILADAARDAVGGRLRRLELSVPDRDGARIELTLLPCPDPSGYVIVIGHDAVEPDVAPSEPTDLAERLQRSEELRRTAADLALVGGWSIGADGVHYWSEEMFDVLDAPSDLELTAAATLEMYSPDDRAHVEQLIRDAFLDGRAFDAEFSITTFSGRPLVVRAIGRPHVDETGTIDRVVGALQDVTGWREFVADAEATARRLALTLESMTSALYTLDREFRFTYLNQKAAQLIGRRVEQLLGRSLWDEYPEASDGIVRVAYERAMSDGVTQEIDEFYYESLDTWFEAVICPTESGLAVYFRDVTAERAARLSLEQREAELSRQAALLDEATDAIVVYDLEHRVTFWNRAAELTYGWSATEAVGADIRMLLHDGNGRYDAAFASLLEFGAWTGELMVQSRAGHDLLVAARWTMLRADDGEPSAVLAIQTDVTEQRRIELQLMRSQRVESLGTLAGGIAHDLNNMLSPILVAAELLELEDSAAERAELLGMIQDSARRGARLVSQVLSFARGTEGERTAVDVAELVGRVRTIATETFPKNIGVVAETERELPTVLADDTQLQQVLLNLAVNARDAMLDGGKLVLRAGTAVLDAQYLAAAGAKGIGDGTFVVITVEDSGTGMPPDVLDRIFEPFFTTKAKGAGTGLGLATSLGIVKSHGGFMTVSSETGRGSVFQVHLPAARVIDRAVEDERPGRPGHAGEGLTILLVDDEAPILDTTGRALRSFGYRVLEAANGAEAVAVFAAASTPIDVVIIDMMMPVMDGPTTVHALRSLDPEVRVVAVSGMGAPSSQADQFRVDEFLPKPYTTRALLDVIAAVLAR